MAVSYDARRFRPLRQSPNGEISADTLYEYHQEGSVVWATYSGGQVRNGHLIATVEALGTLDMRYHHVNAAGLLITGICRSVPELLPDGRIRLHEEWQRTSGDLSGGYSVVEEVGS